MGGGRDWIIPRVVQLRAVTQVPHRSVIVVIPSEKGIEFLILFKLRAIDGIGVV